MIEILLVVLIVVNIVMFILLLFKFGQKNLSKIVTDMKSSEEGNVYDEFSRNREEFNRSFKQLREEIHHSITTFSKTISESMVEISKLQNTQFENIRGTVEEKLKQIQEDNSKKLEEMRITVDEKLHLTLEKRLGEAFKFVSDRLDKVHQGLGEMQELATGVGDLKRVLTNVKARGTLGEIQLKNQLSQLLSTQQYGENVKTKEGSDDFVEFAIKLPGKENTDKSVWLPIDSKFPLEKYELLLNEYDHGDWYQR